MTGIKEYESIIGKKGEFFKCEIYLQNAEGEYRTYEMSSDYIVYPLAIYENKILMGVILEYNGSNYTTSTYDKYLWIDIDSGNAVSFTIDNTKRKAPEPEKIGITISEIAK